MLAESNDQETHDRLRFTLFEYFVVEIEKYGKEHGHLARLAYNRAMIEAATSDIRAQIGPVTAHQELQNLANDHWLALSESRKRVQTTWGG
jgi:hypothetical protein